MFGTLPPPDSAIEGVQRALTSGRYNGYGLSCGLLETREAVARHFTTEQAPLTADVINTLSASAVMMQFNDISTF